MALMFERAYQDDLSTVKELKAKLDTLRNNAQSKKQYSLPEL